MLMEQELRDKMERDAEQYRAFQESVDRRFEELIASTSRWPGVEEYGSDESDNPNIEEDESDAPIKYDASDEKNILTSLFKYDALDSFRIVLDSFRLVFRFHFGWWPFVFNFDAGICYCRHLFCWLWHVVYSSHHDWVLFLGFRCAAYIRSLLYFLPRVEGVSYTLSSMNIFSVYLVIGNVK